MSKASIVDDIYARMKDDTEMEQEPPVGGESEIRRFYAGKAILLTGATGFMGKVYVEKILRGCPDIKTLYVLVRQKKGVTQEEKMRQYFQDFIFDSLRKLNPDFESKVVTIKGDLQEDHLGLSAADRELLINEVDVIVHSGATTKFDEKVSVALTINVLATKCLLDLAMDCKHVKAFMYVSTAYSHCYQQHIEEKFYDSPADLKIVRDMIAADSESTQGITDEAMKMLLGKWPNVYVFTKSIAEDLVRQYGEKANFACGVYRPSIVSAASREPIPGWIGNNNGPAYVFLGTGLGLVHTIYYLGYPMDLVPVDMSINSLIAATYDLPDRCEREKRPVVYNYGSTTVAPVHPHKMYDYLYNEIKVLGSKHILWNPFFVFTTSKILFFFYHILCHMIPALLADTFLLVTGNKPRCLSIFWFGTKHMSKILYFLNGNWRIHVAEMMKVNDRLGPADRELFKFDLRDFDWEEFITTYARASRIHVLKEPLDNVGEMRKRFHKLQLLHNVVATVLGLIGVYYAYRVLYCLMSAIV